MPQTTKSYHKLQLIKLLETIYDFVCNRKLYFDIIAIFWSSKTMQQQFNFELDISKEEEGRGSKMMWNCPFFYHDKWQT